MKILVMVKQVPDTATQVKISGNPKAIETTGITWIVSPYDEFAIEEALRIKEKRGEGEVVAVTLGPDRAKEALRSCLAMGADRAVHLKDPAWDAADTLTTARAIAAVIKQEAPGLALFAPVIPARATMFSARQRLGLESDAASPGPYTEQELYPGMTLPEVLPLAPRDAAPTGTRDE